MHADRDDDFMLTGAIDPARDTVAFRGEPARDPRKDPQPGDVVAVGTDVREVVERMGDRIEYGFPRRAATRWINLMQWQVWARHADVRKVAA